MTEAVGRLDRLRLRLALWIMPNDVVVAITDASELYTELLRVALDHHKEDSKHG